ncbi:hypothetical protein GCM10010145_19920 [Streptomyces ruber]|uniref:Uncharacterized protein n=2 Tax=Streptomyces TaxID=1883 RepID=A0A918BCF7_9ACTN|nr:hypothetical protein [Streptomyces ruber]GGQ50827.1 hypothetical protein GCM10010145_19920 [Streptomyces ruber]
MSEQTPSQAEGERDDSAAAEAERGAGETREHADTPRSTPSQAEGDRGDEKNERTAADGRE